ncbi:MAG: GldG family protein [Nitrospinae bacterium]|nr:GldG family protein [Nitrospinota bacterium]
MNRLTVTLVGLLALLLVAAGLVGWSIEGSMTLLTAGLAWGGMMLGLVLLYVRFSDIKRLVGRKSSRYAANMVVMVGVFFTVVVLMSVLGERHKSRVDLTREGRFTLSSQTVKTLAALEDPVHAIAFYRSEAGTVHAKQRQEAQDLLEEYASLSPKFTFQFVDPDRNPGLASKYGVSEYRIILFMSGGRSVKIGNEREETFTNKLIKLVQEKQKSVYFVVGHGENDLSSTGKNGYRVARDALMQENYLIKELPLLQVPEVPSDAAVVVISSPEADLTKPELDKLDRYYTGGGALLAQIDPGHPPAFKTWLEQYGFRLQDDVIIDQQSQVYGSNHLTPVVYAYHAKHPLTEGFTLLSYFPIANSVYIDEDPAKGRYQLALTGPNSWTEVDRTQLESGQAEYNEDRERRGPVPVMAVTTTTAVSEAMDASAEERRYGKFLLVGDSDFANNTNINLAGNGDLFLNTVNWLSDEADLIAVRAKKRGETPVVLTASQGRAIFWIPVVLVPSAVLISGVGIYSRRRWAR